MAHDDNHIDKVEHLAGPALDENGFLVGEIALPGGLPPDEGEDEDEDARLGVPRWEDALAVDDRDRYVLFDPDTPGGFRALTRGERAELTDAVRAGTPAGITSTDDAAGPALVDGTDIAEQAHGGDVEAHRPTHDSASESSALDQSIADAYDRGPRIEPSTGRSWDPLGHWARELPVRSPRAGGADDRDEIERRLDQARTRLTGYTWRDGVDRDQALADRREQLGRWYDDDGVTERATEDRETDTTSDGFAGRGPCLIYDHDSERDR